jgi:hypothetical protein
MELESDSGSARSAHPRQHVVLERRVRLDLGQLLEPFRLGRLRGDTGALDAVLSGRGW